MAARDLIVESIALDDIFITGNRRSIDREAVERLAGSIRDIGLRTPITVRYVEHHVDPAEGELEGAYLLVAGGHRIEAARSLGRSHIDCEVVRWTERQARKWEISENLDRADLTELQRKSDIAEWIAIAEAEQTERQSAQPAPIESRRSDGKGHRAEGGINAAARELGIDRTEAQRAVKIASISTEAKEAAVAAKLADNQSALMAIARTEPALQVAKVAELAEAKATKLDTDIKNRAAEEMAEAIVEHMPHALHGMMKENAWVCARPLAIALTNLLGGAIMDKGAA